MKVLVQGQKIRIDNHRRGAGGVDYYDGKKKNGEYQIRVPLNSDRPVTVNCDENERIPSKLLKEVQTAFGDREKRERFVEGIRKSLQGYSIRDKNAPEVDRVRDALRRISNAFDLGWDEGQVMSYLHYTKTQGVTFISLLPRGEYTYYVRINYMAIVVADYSKMPRRYVSEWEVL